MRKQTIPYHRLPFEGYHKHSNDDIRCCDIHECHSIIYNVPLVTRPKTEEYRIGAESAVLLFGSKPKRFIILLGWGINIYPSFI